MAKNFLSGLRLANLTSDPVSGSEGELYYNTVSDKVRIFSDGAWRDLSASTSGSLVNIDSIQYPDYIAFDITPESTSASVGTLAWDTGENNLSLQLTTNSNIGIGQELIVYCRNGEATQLNKGEVVRLSGASGQRPLVSRAYNLNDTGSALTVGIVNENIAAGAEGFIVTQGIVREINTNGFNEGDTLYVSASPGILTNIAPVAPQHFVIVGVVAWVNNLLEQNIISQVGRVIFFHCDHNGLAFEHRDLDANNGVLDKNSYTDHRNEFIHAGRQPVLYMGGRHHDVIHFERQGEGVHVTAIKPAEILLSKESR